MASFRKRVWWLIFSVGVALIASCRFNTSLSYQEVGLHLAAITMVYLAMLFPTAELFDSLGLTLCDLFEATFDAQKYNFIEYMCLRKTFIYMFMLSYPFLISFYFAHGNFLMMNQNEKRFPPLFDYPEFWYCALFASVLWFFACIPKTKEHTKSELFAYFDVHPEVYDDIEAVVHHPDTFKIRFSRHEHLYCTHEYFIYVSNWKFVAVKQDDLRLQVDATRMPNLPNPEDDEHLRHIYVKVGFRRSYFNEFTIFLRHDLYRQLNQILAIPIIVPPHITIPLTIMEELKADFLARVAQNPKYTHHVKKSEMDPCFACGTEENIIKIVKTCVDSHERWQWTKQGEIVPTRQCEACVCRPLWCQSCIAHIFIGKQNIDELFRQDYWRGTAQCPTCRKHFCIPDVHLVEFIFEDETETPPPQAEN